MVFSFFTFLSGVFKSSVFNSLKNAIFIFNKCCNWYSSLYSKPDIWVLHILILQCRLNHTFIFVFRLKLPSSNLPKSQQGAQILPVFQSKLLALLLFLNMKSGNAVKLVRETSELLFYMLHSSVFGKVREVVGEVKYAFVSQVRILSAKPTHNKLPLSARNFRSPNVTHFGHNPQ